MNDAPGNPAPPETRKLAAIMFTDMVGFSRQRSSLDEAKRNPGRGTGVSPDFIRATTGRA